MGDWADDEIRRAERLAEEPPTLFEGEEDTLLDESKPSLVTEHRVDVIARFLAGFGFPARHSYEKLTKAQQRTAREAAEAALRRLDAHTD